LSVNNKTNRGNDNKATADLDALALTALAPGEYGRGQEWFDLVGKLQYMGAILQPESELIECNKEVSF
jgi:hypothetical protein